jgi:hypothetical protein
LFLIQEEELKLKGRRLWVVFDEFNTTLEVQLLVDLILNKKLDEFQFKKDTVFIGLCNPYKYVDLSDFKIGL